MKKRISIGLILIIFSIVSVLFVRAEEADGEILPAYNGATTIEKNTNKEKGRYTSSTALQNAVLVNKGSSKLVSPVIKKTGDGTSEVADLYGTNAAVLAINESVLSLEKANINTNGRFAHGVFSYGTATVNLSSSRITTIRDNSSGLMVSGGKIHATNTTVETEGNSSSAIRSYQEGDISVEGGSYSSTGANSPSIYSNSFVSLEGSKLETKASEGIIIDGSGSVELTNSTLTSNNTKLFEGSTSPKNVYMFNSNEGEGSNTFKATESTITTNKGDTIFVTNTKAEINLDNNTIVNKDPNGVVLNIQNGKANVTLEEQQLEGEVKVDKQSNLDLFISTNSLYKGIINKDNQGKVKLSISSESTFILQGNSYVSSLENPIENNSNIYANGYKLFVNGKEVKINGNEYGKKPTKVVEEKTDYTMFYYIGGGVMAFLLLLIIIILVIRKSKEAKAQKAAEVVQLPMMDATPKSMNEIYKNMKK